MRKRKDHNQEALFVRTGAAARLLGVTATTVRAAVRRGELRAIRFGNRMLIQRESLERLLEPDTRTIFEPTA